MDNLRIVNKLKTDIYEETTNNYGLFGRFAG